MHIEDPISQLIAHIRLILDIVFGIFLDLERNTVGGTAAADHIAGIVEPVGGIVYLEADFEPDVESSCLFGCSVDFSVRFEYHTIRQTIISHLEARSDPIKLVRSLDHTAIGDILNSGVQTTIRNFRSARQAGQCNFNRLLPIRCDLQSTADFRHLVSRGPQANLRDIFHIVVGRAGESSKCAVVFTAYRPVIVQLNAHRIDQFRLQSGQRRIAHIGDKHIVVIVIGICQEHDAFLSVRAIDAVDKQFSAAGMLADHRDPVVFQRDAILRSGRILDGAGREVLNTHT